MSIDYVKLSRTVSHALRHEPGAYGLTLDSQGWVSVDHLLGALRNNDPLWQALTERDLTEMIGRSAKVRHEIAGNRIRALYGHSTSDPLLREPSRPPDVLFHGTDPVAAQAIQAQGLKPMARQNVHLSLDRETARQVGVRKNAHPVILRIQADQAYHSGVSFYEGNSLVWLADYVPAVFISVVTDG
jgi:putative RNA 2'-phosphotransferase